MKSKDLLMIALLVLIFLPFLFSAELYQFYLKFNKEHGLIMAMLKFGILATLGETIGHRIKTGQYYAKGFGILPRAIVWALLGVTIALAFKVFSFGVPETLKNFGLIYAADAMKEPFTCLKLFTAFCISTAMNLTYAPVMMTLHKITDTHIAQNKGKLSCLTMPIPFARIFTHINWDVQWNFVFKKSIPFFWIPAHTITFLLPTQFQVLFAAILGIVLGVILAIASVMGKKKQQAE
jgi:hypothetical protein